MPRLRRIDPSTAGFSRRRRGKGWTYHDQNGNRIVDTTVLTRIEGLVIPPAWREVWICAYPRGHIQATGLDAAGRRQYHYHDLWRIQQDQAKFEHVLDIAERLPAAREQIAADLAGSTMSRTRVLACAGRLLELGFFRVGSEEYAEHNQTYGLATIRKEHVTVSRGGVLTFAYPAKSGKQRVRSVADDGVLAVVRTLKLRRSGGTKLLAYKEHGRWRDVRSSEVNDYLREVFDTEVSAKDFRTWHATVLAAVGLAVSAHAASSATARKRAVNRVIKEVSEYLGNTPAVCRSSYVDPRIIDRWQDGETVLPALSGLGEQVPAGNLATQGPVEAAVLALLRDAHEVRRAG